MQAPTAYEVGAYGLESVDSHLDDGDSGTRPLNGVHLAIEADTLANVDSYMPAEAWVSGAQRFDLGSLAPTETVSFDVLLSISTVTTVVPLPPALLLLGSVLGGLGWFGRRRRSSLIPAAA